MTKVRSAYKLTLRINFLYTKKCDQITEQEFKDPHYQ